MRRLTPLTSAAMTPITPIAAIAPLSRAAGVLSLVRRSSCSSGRRVQIALERPAGHAHQHGNQQGAVAGVQAAREEGPQQPHEEQDKQGGHDAGQKRHVVRLEGRQVDDTAARLVLRDDKDVVLRRGHGARRTRGGTVGRRWRRGVAFFGVTGI